MVLAVYAGDNGAVKVSPWWLVASYGVITVGELCLSPMGLSFVSKLSPARITALMMGGFFLANSVGNKLSGILASTWYSYDNKMNYFLVNFALLIFATLLGASMLKTKRKRTFNANKNCFGIIYLSTFLFGDGSRGLCW